MSKSDANVWWGFLFCFFRLRSIDIEFMKRLGRIVSIVPVIAKADALTIEERQEFKERVNTFHIHSGSKNPFLGCLDPNPYYKKKSLSTLFLNFPHILMCGSCRCDKRSWWRYAPNFLTK